MRVNHSPLLFLLVFAVLFTVPCAWGGYAVRQLYKSDGFSGITISGRTILILPFLTRSGFDTAGVLSPALLHKNLAKKRRDLRLSVDRSFESDYYAKHDTASLDSFYANLFRGELVALQTADSVWKTMKTPYILAIRLKNGATIIDFGHRSHRLLLLEAELWDVKTAEVVLRIGVTGRSADKKQNNGEFIRRALLSIFDSVPVAPYAENPDEEW